MNFEPIFQIIPSVQKPIQRLSLKEKLKWTSLILLLYFAMTQIQVYGVSKLAEEQFGFFEIMLGARFGSLMTLGIGPIVTASILLQLLVGSKIINWDMTNTEQRKLFQNTQKLLAIVFTVLEAAALVIFGTIPSAIPGSIGLTIFLIFQLCLGGWLVILMDEIVTKWGFGSGISLFIAAGISSQILTRAINPFAINCSGGIRGGSTICLPDAANPPLGLVPQFFVNFGTWQSFLYIIPIIATIIVFLVVVYAQAIRVEIPLAFGSFRGFGRNWPLKFIYTSNIPVILTGALLVNIRMFALMLAQRGITIFGTFDASNHPAGGLILYMTMPSATGIQVLMLSIGLFLLIGALLAIRFIKRRIVEVSVLSGLFGILIWFLISNIPGLTSVGAITLQDLARLVIYSSIMVMGAIVFSVFWVSTSGMDAKSVAQQIQSIGMQIPGFRRDPRIIESVLDKYIPQLAILGGAFVGILAAFADSVNALGTGTGILLTVMIIYNFYEQLTMQHLEDLHPALRKMLGR